MCRGNAPVAEPISFSQRLKIGALCISYIAVSASLIRFNKFLMAPGRFPHSLALTSMHMFGTMMFSSILFACCPSWFPGMQALQGKRGDALKWFLPIACLFAVSLYASNQAYMYSGVAFLQFMKEGNVILSFLLSCAVGLQVMNRVRLAVIVWIFAGSLVCISQDVKFVWLGFLFQILSQFAECGRAVMGEVVLSGNSMKLDPLTYTLCVSPFCFVLVCTGTFVTWSPEIAQDFASVWVYLIPNVCIAFILNLLVASVIKEVSAVGFMLTGMAKDIVLVCVSAMAFGEPVAILQAVSFTMVILGILFWSLMKTSPEHDAVRFAEQLLGLPSESSREAGTDLERTPLITKAKSLDSVASLSTTTSKTDTDVRV